ncbi:chromatin-remodeling complex subunit ies6 [Dioscorea cayenensis subsp. rotundata]|uniref:Chromatin-remodeling complex subunit ies6 n=1 Tax=Dioscorea cayennensis subsp. rotundata TaxID=55577 RepID=A0AB40D1I5_DIOCR|nr:chromatin-remodeling complex subunit ies6 [Dioscorea cayenensis subsp. rotundata]
MEPEVVNSEMALLAVLPFKRIQMSDKYPKAQSRGRHWKHLKQILQAENFLENEPNYLSIESPPSMYPPKKFCDVTGFKAPYVDPRTSLRYASPDVLKCIRYLPNEYVQRYLSLRNAAIVLK